MNEGDFEVKAEILGEAIKLVRLQPGDILLAQPSKPLSSEQSNNVHRQLDRMVDGKVKVLVVPATWKLVVAREVVDEEVVQGFAAMLKELG